MVGTEKERTEKGGIEAREREREREYGPTPVAAGSGTEPDRIRPYIAGPTNRPNLDRTDG